VADAAWKPRRVRLRRGSVDLERGQLLGSSRYLADRWKWTEPRVRRFLNRISGRRADDRQSTALSDAETDALVDAHPTAHGTVITIRNYDMFQKTAKLETMNSVAKIDALQDASNGASTDPKPTQREEEINNNTLLKESEDTRGTWFPEDFVLNDQTYNWAIERSANAEMVKASLARFCDHYRQVIGSQGLSRDWQAKFRLWFDQDLRRRDEAEPASGALEVTQLQDSDWETILRFYAQTGVWTRHISRYGPDPTCSSCRVPYHLLQKYQLRPEVNGSKTKEVPSQNKVTAVADGSARGGDNLLKSTRPNP
jgi:hypothetical protein